MRRARWRTVFGVAVIPAVLAACQSSHGANRGTSAHGSAAGGCGALPLYLGDDSVRHIDKLSYLDLVSRAAGQTTADPAGSNDDRSNTIATLPTGGSEVFSADGPGVLTNMRSQETFSLPLSLQVDDNPALTMANEAFGPLSLSGDPFPFPLSMSAAQDAGSSVLNTGIGFARRLRWDTAKRSWNFYALYKKLPVGTPIRPWTPLQRPADAAMLLRQGAEGQLPASRLTSITRQVTLPSSTSVASLTNGPAQLREIQITAPFLEKVRVGNSRLQIRWDGAATPDVDAPIKYLAGDGAGVYQPPGAPLVRSYMTTIDGDGRTYLTYRMWWPMPYRHTADIRIVTPRDAGPLPGITVKVSTEPFPDAPCRWAPFHATYTEIPHPVPGHDMTFLDVNGTGKLVGTVVNFGTVGPTLEGDPHVYVDGAFSPQIQATGTEEWGFGGDYWDGGNRTTTPLAGLPSFDRNPPGTDTEGAAEYRWLIQDQIPFTSSVRVDWEHGGVDDVNGPYAATVLWYGTRTPRAIRTSEFEAGDPVQGAAHQLVAPGATTTVKTGAWWYPVVATVAKFAVVNSSAEQRFSAQLEPNNVGAFLRRTLDTTIRDQEADVFIDGVFAGRWLTAGGFNAVDTHGNARIWRDDEFPLPATLTRAKRTIRVSIVPLPGTSWTAARYSLYTTRDSGTTP